ncbi:extracellular solute-binding protein [Ensifer adhaerens]|uniref:extracellular solute-binding protein n=1 Tax=Ensifer adhaerens TaxID=106592 RepID=UPI001C4E00DD|nr:extracellular solute-binding protein [Ensifer adhaerens]MBW0370814.1 extracellular solute-binding protein [Ensifer adhaerens]UCM24272.1 extracellular solute-binding protein [Ensifer adhaerens]
MLPKNTTTMLACLVAAAAGLPASTHAQDLPNLKGKSFAFAGFGGDLQKNQDLAWLQPFADATGVKIVQTDSPTVAALKTQQEAKNVGVDVIEIESSTVDANCGTTFQVVDINRSQLDPALDRNKCGVPVVKFSFVLAYNAAKYKEPPTKVADFFDVESFPGVRAAPAGSNVGLVETALLADGVEPWKLYPIDLDRAVKKIESVKSSIEVKSTFAMLQDGLANGEFDMAILPNGRAYNASKTNPDVKVVFDGAVTLYDNLAIPTGAKNVEAATEFLNYVALNQTQSSLTERFPYGKGTVGEEPPKLDDQAKLFFPDTYGEQLVIQDNSWWAANDQNVNDRLTSLFSQ